MKQLAISLLLLSGLFAANGNAELLHYIPDDGSEGGILISRDGKEVFLGHIGVESQSCNYGDIEICIFFDGHLFTFVNEKLYIDGFFIENLGEQKVIQSGVEMALTVISVTSDLFENRFWYSKEKGLQVIQLSLRSELRTDKKFFLQSICGYGASEKCSNNVMKR